LFVETLRAAGSGSFEIALGWSGVAAWAEALATDGGRFSIVDAAGRHMPFEVSAEATASHCLSADGETICVITPGAADALAQFLASRRSDGAFPVDHIDIDVGAAYLTVTVPF
jgi:hypothetical protein